MNKYKLSVIVPVYMVEKYVAKCIDSIINQSYTNLEIILVDDGSKDNSGRICDDYKEKDDRIIVIHKDNGGLSSARNIGIENATGQLITFVDSDDYIKCNMYDMMIDCLCKNNLDVICCNYESDSTSKNEKNESAFKVLKHIDAVARLLDEDGYRCYSWNKIYKKELFDNVKFPEGLFYEDIITNYKLFLKANRIGYVNAKLYVYNYRVGSITSEMFNEKKYDLFFAINELSSDAKTRDKKMYKMLLPGCVRYYFYFVNSAIRSDVEIKTEISFLKRFIRDNYFSIVTSKKVSLKILMQSTFFLINEKIYAKLLMKAKPIG